MNTNMNFEIYDIVKLPNGEEFEILQVRPETILALPSEGGIPKVFPKEEFANAEILSSLVSEAKEISTTEKWKRIIEEAKERWRQHSIFSKASKKKTSTGGKKTNGLIDLGADFDKI